MIKIAIIYHQFPHYRAPILRTLARSVRYDYQFWSSVNDFSGIKAFQGDAEVKINELQVVETKKSFRIKGYLDILNDPTIDAFVILGNPNIVATWILAAIGRLQGRKVLFWAHGWLRKESLFKSLVRNIYFRLSNILLVYGERSKTIGVELGYPENRIHVIYNSLDFDNSLRIFRDILSNINRSRTQIIFANPNRPLLICTARLTQLCRFDLLIKAANLLAQRGKSVNVLLIGDGPARSSLEEYSKELMVDVHFFGACYDEFTLANMIFDADATVSPGKIGLTAIHSLSYGTPAFTHSDLDQQMPEVEVIQPGLTGDLFRNGDVIDLADTLQRWLEGNPDRNEVRKACIKVIAEKWTPINQRYLIERALDTCFAEAL